MTNATKQTLLAGGSLIFAAIVATTWPVATAWGQDVEVEAGGIDPCFSHCHSEAMHTYENHLIHGASEGFAVFAGNRVLWQCLQNDCGYEPPL